MKSLRSLFRKPFFQNVVEFVTSETFRGGHFDTIRHKIRSKIFKINLNPQKFDLKIVENRL